GLRQLRDVLLDHDEPPELAGVEVVAVAEGAGVGRIAANIRSTLERGLADVDHHGHVRRGLLARPAVRLRIESELEVVDANRAQVCATKVEYLLALGW